MGANQDYYAIKAISATSLKWFETSPKYFKAMLDKEIEQVTLSWLERGKQIHMYLLEPTKFKENYTYLEFDVPKNDNQKKFCEDIFTNRTKSSAEDKAVEAYKSNYSCDKLSDDKIKEKALELKKNLSRYITYLKKRTEYKDILNRSTWQLLKDIDITVDNHKLAKELLTIEQKYPEGNLPEWLEVYNEFEILWQYPKLNLDCKSALDRLVINHQDKVIELIDLKTTSNLSEFKTSFNDYKYYRQLAFYWLAVGYYLKEKGIDYKDYTCNTKIIAIQIKDLVECKVFNISDLDLRIGLDEIEFLLPQLHWHYTNDKWEHAKEYYEGTGLEQL